MSEAGPFEVLEGHRYMHRTTYRRNGEAVPTTVWFALVEGRAYAFTSMRSASTAPLVACRCTNTVFISK
jgi:hypothetical protein